MYMCVCVFFFSRPKVLNSEEGKRLYNIQINTNYMYIYACIQISDLE